MIGRRFGDGACARCRRAVYGVAVFCAPFSVCRRRPRTRPATTRKERARRCRYGAAFVKFSRIAAVAVNFSLRAKFTAGARLFTAFAASQKRGPLVLGPTYESNRPVRCGGTAVVDGRGGGGAGGRERIETVFGFREDGEDELRPKNHGKWNNRAEQLRTDFFAGRRAAYTRTWQRRRWRREIFVLVF